MREKSSGSVPRTKAEGGADLMGRLRRCRRTRSASGVVYICMYISCSRLYLSRLSRGRSRAIGLCRNGCVPQILIKSRGQIEFNEFTLINGTAKSRRRNKRRSAKKLVIARACNYDLGGPLFQVLFLKRPPSPPTRRAGTKAADQSYCV